MWTVRDVHTLRDTAVFGLPVMLILRDPAVFGLPVMLTLL